MLLTPLLSLVLSAALSAPGRSAPPTPDIPRVATLPLQIEGKLPLKWKKEAASSLLEGITRGGVEVVIATNAPETCTDSACLQAVGEKLGTDLVLHAVFTVDSEKRDYRIVLRVLNTETGVELTTIEGRCELCGFGEAVDAVRAKSAALGTALAKLQLGASEFRITSKPASVDLELDGKDVGTTPLTLAVVPGTHRLTGSASGYLPQTFEIDAVEGINKEFQFQLAAVPKDGAREASRPGRSFVIGGAVATGLGIAGLVAGGVLLGIDGKPYQKRCDVDLNGNCRLLYGTRTPGIISLALGGASLIAGVTLLVLGHRKRSSQRSNQRARVSPLGVTLRF